MAQGFPSCLLCFSQQSQGSGSALSSVQMLPGFMRWLATKLYHGLGMSLGLPTKVLPSPDLKFTVPFKMAFFMTLLESRKRDAKIVERSVLGSVTKVHHPTRWVTTPPKSAVTTPPVCHRWLSQITCVQLNDLYPAPRMKLLPLLTEAQLLQE